MEPIWGVPVVILDLTKHIIDRRRHFKRAGPGKSRIGWPSLVKGFLWHYGKLRSHIQYKQPHRRFRPQWLSYCYTRYGRKLKNFFKKSLRVVEILGFWHTCQIHFFYLENQLLMRIDNGNYEGYCKKIITFPSIQLMVRGQDKQGGGQSFFSLFIKLVK